MKATKNIHGRLSTEVVEGSPDYALSCSLPSNHIISSRSGIHERKAYLSFCSGTDGVKPYNILILFFSLAYMAITLDITGVLRAAAFWVSNKGGTDGYRLFLYFYMMLTALSVVLGNDPVILSGTVFLVYYTTVTQVTYDYQNIDCRTHHGPAQPDILVDVRVRGRKHCKYGSFCWEPNERRYMRRVFRQ